ncbi:MAG TPA: hypothetical protein VJ867_06340 [Gemmatimonadaceae bacterium]|nr:hypothetical protein [Gemmatimonadaceae bacterium]
MGRGRYLCALLAIALASRVNAQGIASQAGTSACPATAADTATARDTARTGSADSARGAARRDSSALPSPEHATIVLYASASAREVRFAAQPRIVVRLCGAVSDSVHVLERRNLPERVQPGVTYRDVFIAVEIIGHLRADSLRAAFNRPRR